MTMSGPVRLAQLVQLCRSSSKGVVSRMMRRGRILAALCAWLT